jgi:hypothetical protein
MSDFDQMVQALLSNTSPPASSGQFNISGLPITSAGTIGSASALLGLGSTTTGQYNYSSTGGGSSIAGVANSFTNTATAASSTPDSDTVDFRVRLRAQGDNPVSKARVYGPANSSSNILNILYDTNGMMFPFTPTIQWNQAVEYDTMHFVHSNQDFQAYKNTPSTNIEVSGQFTFQNQREGEYMLACMHFLRTVSKMYFGQSNPTLAGLPPPILLFSGYGNYMFNDLPVIVKSHSYSLDNTVDYITVNTAGGTARLPAIITISVSLVVQNTPKDLRTKFDLDQFRTGALMRNNKGWI